jgi:hypothetical protein
MQRDLEVPHPRPTQPRHRYLSKRQAHQLVKNSNRSIGLGCERARPATEEAWVRYDRACSADEDTEDLVSFIWWS